MTPQLFSLDIGTQHTRIAQAGKGIVLCEPTLIADCGNLPIGLAVGADVTRMQGKLLAGMRLSQPFLDGHLASPGATTLLVRALLQRLRLRAWSRPSFRLVVPGQATALERAQLVHAVRAAGVERISLAVSSIASAHACGVEVSRTSSAAVIDIGASLTEMAIVSEQIVFRRGLRLGGSDFDEVMRDALNIQAGVEVSLTVARDVKERVGCSSADGDTSDVTVTGRSRACGGLPRHSPVARSLIYGCLEPPLQRLEELLRGVLDQLSPLVCKDIQRDGLFLAGGGALLGGLPEYLEHRLGVRFHRVPDPIHCAALGALALPPELCEEAGP